ncbi:MAG TPA: NADH-quinone oxidoreductase subunit C [Candidatus Acidoferrales bacterium]|jgi:NADH-quinone oxidoreductase subunit C|nr:NADH-quinone oxidoreductase subunit C [Candidatus Acidoferrales bacterium]
MLPENLKEHSTAAAVEAFDADAVNGGRFERNELTLDIAPPKIASICGFLKYDQNFIRLSSVTAVDRYPAEPRFEVVYHLHAVDRNARVRLKCRVRGEDPVIESVASVWRSANWYEREVFDLFGIHFLNHPDLRRIMMPDDWEGYPLRKDYPIAGTRV